MECKNIPDTKIGFGPEAYESLLKRKVDFLALIGYPARAAVLLEWVEIKNTHHFKDRAIGIGVYGKYIYTFVTRRGRVIKTFYLSRPYKGSDKAVIHRVEARLESFR